ATWKAGFPADNYALKGLAIGLGTGEGRAAPAQVLFDTELLRVAAVATDQVQLLRGTAYDGAHGPCPEFGGQQILGAPPLPGWSTEGTDFTDPRAIPYGPLPRERGRYRRYYQDGRQVVISYALGA